MIDKYIFNYGYEMSEFKEDVNKTFEINNHKVSGDIYYKLFRKARKNCERLTFHKVYWKNYKTNSVTYNEYTTFKRSIK